MIQNTYKRKSIQHEGIDQQYLFQWAAFARGRFPELDLLFHIPNGGSRNYYEAVNLKKQGVRAGVPDLCLPVARGKFHGLFIELKYGANTPTDLQCKWINALNAQGYYAAVCYGWENAKDLIERYLREEV